MNEPIVPRPPTLNLPKRLNGAEQVIRLGVIWRITITFDGSWGINFEVILAAFLVFYYIGLELTPFLFILLFSRLSLYCRNWTEACLLQISYCP